MSTVGQVTHMRCPKAGADTTHHLIPRRGVMTCIYCDLTAEQIEADRIAVNALIERMHSATTIDSAAASQMPDAPGVTVSSVVLRDIDEPLLCEADHIDGKVCSAKLSILGNCPQSDWHAKEATS